MGTRGPLFRTEALKPVGKTEEPRNSDCSVDAQILAVVSRLAPPRRVTALALPDNCSVAERESDMALAGRMLRQTVPNVQFEFVAAMPPVPDGKGGDLWIEPFSRLIRRRPSNR